MKKDLNDVAHGPDINPAFYGKKRMTFYLYGWCIKEIYPELSHLIDGKRYLTNYRFYPIDERSEEND